MWSGGGGLPGEQHAADEGVEPGKKEDAGSGSYSFRIAGRKIRRARRRGGLRGVVTSAHIHP